MKPERLASTVFAISAVYDGALGLGFLLLPEAIFTRFAVTPPNHWGYVQFAAAMLVVFALMFVQVARNPRANRNLMPYGILLKLAYSGVVLAYWLGPDLPDMWKPFAVADSVFAVLFVWVWVRVPRPV